MGLFTCCSSPADVGSVPAAAPHPAHTSPRRPSMDCCCRWCSRHPQARELPLAQGGSANGMLRPRSAGAWARWPRSSPSVRVVSCWCRLDRPRGRVQVASRRFIGTASLGGARWATHQWMAGGIRSPRARSRLFLYLDHGTAVRDEPPSRCSASSPRSRGSSPTSRLPGAGSVCSPACVAGLIVFVIVASAVRELTTEPLPCTSRWWSCCC